MVVNNHINPMTDSLELELVGRLNIHRKTR